MEVIFRLFSPPIWHHCNFTFCLGKTLTEPSGLAELKRKRLQFGEAELARIHYINAKRDGATQRKNFI